MKIHECIISLLGGTGIFIAAMNMLSSGLQKVAGTGMRTLLGKITNNRFACVGIGAIVTMIIQSSAATTVMTIGFVNADTMNLYQATGIIMGANIGTTITGLLASLQSLNISIYFGFLTFVGVVMMFFKKDIIKNVGGIICGLGMIFIGLDIMSDSCKEDSIKNLLRDGLEKINFPLVLILLGIIFTALIQSSSAMTGLIIVMVQGGSMEIGSALFIVLGSNIGTCVTALISTIGTTVNAKRAGIIHLLFNCFGTGFFTIVIWTLKNNIIKLLKKITTKPAMQIAWFHVFFNVITTLILLPLINVLVIVACRLIKEKNEINPESKKNRKAFKFINKRFLLAPSIAVEQIKKEIKYMSTLSKKNLEESVIELCEQKNVYIEEVNAREDLIDFLNIEITKFLVKAAPSINEKTVEDMSIYFHLLNHIERIGDHAKQIVDESIDMKKQEIKYSKEYIQNIKKINKVLLKIFDIAIKVFDDNPQDFIHLNELIENFNDYQKQATKEHFDRLKDGKCSMIIGSFYTSTSAHFNSICSHLQNIIGYFHENKEYVKYKTFELSKDYALIVSQATQTDKNDDVSSVKKFDTINKNVNENIEKINKSVG